MLAGGRRHATGLLKVILFGSFWSFLLVLSGIIDIILGLLFAIGVFSVRESPLPISIICFIIGFIYLAAGISIGVAKKRKSSQ
jgi:hypothetical protein